MQSTKYPEEKLTEHPEDHFPFTTLERNVEPEEIQHPGATLGLVMGAYPLALILMLILAFVGFAVFPLLIGDNTPVAPEVSPATPITPGIGQPSDSKTVEQTDTP